MYKDTVQVRCRIGTRVPDTSPICSVMIARIKVCSSMYVLQFSFGYEAISLRSKAGLANGRRDASRHEKEM